MKKLFFCSFLFILLQITAQIKTPQASPKSKLTQTVGLSDITIEYSRPGVKGRTIFGNVVPYDKIWRTGANENTKITFSTDVSIDGKTLKKGTYALYTKPSKSDWEVYFYNEASNWGNPKKWDDAKVSLVTKVTPQAIARKIETFTLSVDDITNTSALLGLMWENTYVGIKFEVPTDKTVEASIKKVMNGPSSSDYYSAAVYYLNNNKDINQAKTWIDKAVKMTKEQPKFWYLYQQALIHKKTGDTRSAKKAAKRSMKLAKKAKYDTYVKKNQELIKSL